MRFDADALAFHGSTLRLADIAPVIDGEAVRGAPDIREVADGWAVEWPVEGGQFRLEVVSVSRGAGVSTGRFLSVLAPADREALAAELADLPTADRNTVPAQLSFPPLLPESAVPPSSDPEALARR